jgi:hypothetical protein
MPDITYIAATGAFFVVAILYVYGCDRLRQEKHHELK